MAAGGFAATLVLAGGPGWTGSAAADLRAFAEANHLPVAVSFRSQDLAHPGRVVGTDLRNPDFAELARAFGAYGEVITSTAAFPAAFERAIAAGCPAVLELRTDPEHDDDDQPAQGEGRAELGTVTTMVARLISGVAPWRLAKASSEPIHAGSPAGRSPAGISARSPGPSASP